MATIYPQDTHYQFKIKVERDMERPFVLNMLTKTYSLCYSEVHLVDLIFLDPKGFKVKAFELKMRDWACKRGVLGQALNNERLFDHSGIIMPYSFLKPRWEKLKKDVEGTKIGVFGVKEGWYRKGWGPEIHTFKKLQKINKREFVTPIPDHNWLQYYVPIYKMYSGGYIQEYKKVKEDY